ncbi:MAG TPA: hypothetical protein PKD85_18505, partial [Saprospiraceae bacterium]|nr:hypothetical protein [Saprospiraceae bacterium]
VSELELEAFIVQNSINLLDKDFEKKLNDALKKVSYSNVQKINEKYSKLNGDLETRGLPCFNAYEKDMANATMAGSACMAGVTVAVLFTGGGALAGTIGCAAVVTAGIIVAEVAYSACMKATYE